MLLAAVRVKAAPLVLPPTPAGARIVSSGALSHCTVSLTPHPASTAPRDDAASPPTGEPPVRLGWLFWVRRAEAARRSRGRYRDGELRYTRSTPWESATGFYAARRCSTSQAAARRLPYVLGVSKTSASAPTRSTRGSSSNRCVRDSRCAFQVFDQPTYSRTTAIGMSTALSELHVAFEHHRRQDIEVERPQADRFRRDDRVRRRALTCTRTPFRVITS